MDFLLGGLSLVLAGSLLGDDSGDVREHCDDSEVGGVQASVAWQHVDCSEHRTGPSSPGRAVTLNV